MQIPTHCQIFRALPDAAIRMWLNKAMCRHHCNWRPAGVLWEIANTIQCRGKRPIDDVMTWKRFSHYWLFVKGIWASNVELWRLFCWYTERAGHWSSWWRHQMEALSALLALCEGNPPVTGGFKFSFICACDMRHHRARYDAIVMCRWSEMPWRSCHVPWALLQKCHTVPEPTGIAPALVASGRSFGSVLPIYKEWSFWFVYFEWYWITFAWCFQIDRL